MEILLLADIPGIGRKNDLVVVGDGFALNYVLPARQALVATPSVRRRYAEQIKRRAEERENEKQMRRSALAAVEGKKITISRKASKTGKLYAGITAGMIAEALKEQHGVTLAKDAVDLPEHIKTIGSHIVNVRTGDVITALTVDVQPA